MLIEHETRFARILKSKSRKLSFSLLHISLLFVSSVSMHAAQEPQGGARAPIPFPSDASPMGPVSAEAVVDTPYDRDVRAMEARAHYLDMQDARHKFQSDAAKLLSLAADLKAEIGNQDSDTLTPAETKKIAEIQKLAHRVRSKLRRYARGY